MDYILITGGSGGIGFAFVQHFLTRTDALVFATYRSDSTKLEELALQHPDRLFYFKMDITQETDIIHTTNAIKQKTDRLHYVINAIGFLQQDTIQPEKNLRSLNTDNLLRYFQVNSIGAALLAKHLVPLFKHQHRSVFATISAKVGSIGDNNLGGWYGYRASKAALNMFMKTVSIEYQRICPQTIVVLLHPGTTDTGLSRPFQGNVQNLFTPAHAVSCLIDTIEKLQTHHSGSFWSWDGSQLPW